MKISALIVDDEPIARELIRLYLREESDIDVAGECASGVEAVEKIAALEPDVVFLDIAMPGMSGLDVLRGLDPRRMPAVVVTTAHDAFAAETLELQALDYLVKPFDRERFRTALRRARTQVLYGSATRLARQMDSLLARIQEKRRYAPRLLVRVGGRMVFVATDEIDWISAEGNYAHLQVGTRRYTLRETLSSLEARLDPEQFVRIHRSTMVNVMRIREVHSMFKGDYLVVLEDGTKLNSSRAYRQSLQMILNAAS